MPKFALLVSYSTEYWDGLISKPSDRTDVVRELVEAAGGTLVSFEYMFGAYDSLVVAEFPSSADAASLSLAVGSTGVLADVETHELIAATDMVKIAEKAAQVRKGYKPPGK